VADDPNRLRTPLTILIVGPAESVHVSRWTRFLVKRGHKVMLYTERDPPEPLGAAETRRWPLGWLPRTVRIFAAAFALAWWRRRMRVDITNVQSMGANSVVTIGLPPRGLVLSAWGSDLLQPSSAVQRALVRHGLRRASLVLTTSCDMASRVRDLLDGRPTPIRVESWGVDGSLFRPPTEMERSEARARWGLPDEAVVVLSPRSVKPLYRTRLIVDAFAQACATRTDLRLVLLAGFEPANSRARAIGVAYRRAAWAAARTLGDRAILIDETLAPSEMASLYWAADAVLSVPLTDQRASSVIEALCAGLLVIGADIPAYRELRDEGHSITLVDDPLVPRLVEALRSVERPTIAERTDRGRRTQTNEDQADRFKAIESTLLTVASRR